MTTPTPPPPRPQLVSFSLAGTNVNMVAAAVVPVLQSEYETPHGRIDLSSCMTVKSAEQKTSKRNALEVSTHDTTYFMYANTEKVTRFSRNT